MVSAGMVMFRLVSAGMVTLRAGDMVQEDLVGVASGEGCGGVDEVGTEAVSASVAHEVEDVVRTVQGDSGRAHRLKGGPVYTVG